MSMSTRASIDGDVRPHAARGVLEQVAGADARAAPRPSSRPSPRARARPAGGSRGADDQVAAADVELVLERSVADHRRERRSTGPAACRSRAIRVREPGGQHDDLVADAPARRRRPAPRSRGSPPPRTVHWTGKRTSSRLRSRSTSTASSCSSSGGAVVPGQSARERVDDVVALAAPRSAPRARRRSRAARRARANAASISRKRSSAKSTRSILFTQATRWRMPSSAARYACRRDCSSRPLRASTSTSARSAVEAPVTMLRV